MADQCGADFRLGISVYCCLKRSGHDGPHWNNELAVVWRDADLEKQSALADRDRRIEALTKALRTIRYCKCLACTDCASLIDEALASAAGAETKENR